MVSPAALNMDKCMRASVQRGSVQFTEAAAPSYMSFITAIRLLHIQRPD